MPRIAVHLCVLIVIFGVYLSVGAFQAPTFPTGADWSQYMMGAQHIWAPLEDTTYPSWRAPLYPYLLGLFSHFGTYIQAATWVSSISWVVMGFSLYWAGALYRHSILGLCLALALVCTPLAVDGFYHFGPYPLLGCLCGLAWVMALGGMRKKGSLFLIGYFAFSGLAIAVDSRSILVSFAALPLLIHKWSSKDILLSSIAGTIALSPHWILTRYLNLSLLSMKEKLLEQRRFVLRHLQGDNLHPDHVDIESLGSVCSSVAPVHFSWGWLWADCSWSMAHVNLKAWEGVGLIFPVLGIVVMLLGFKKWRFGLSLCLLLGLCLVLPMLIVWHPPRYQLPILVPLLISLPLSVVILFEETPMPKGLKALFGLLPLLLVWPASQPPDTPITWDFPPARIPLAERLIEMVGPTDWYLDCARMDTGLLWAPQSRMPSYARGFLPKDEDCQQYIEYGSQGWLLTRTDSDNLPDPSIHGWLETFTIKEQRYQLVLWTQNTLE